MNNKLAIFTFAFLSMTSQAGNRVKPLPGSTPRPAGASYILMMEHSPELESRLADVAGNRVAMGEIMNAELNKLAADVNKWLGTKGLAKKIKISDRLTFGGSMLLNVTDDVTPDQLKALQKAFKGRAGMIKNGTMQLIRPVRPGLRGASLGLAVVGLGVAAEAAHAASQKDRVKTPSSYVEDSIESEATDEFLHHQ